MTRSCWSALTVAEPPVFGATLTETAAVARSLGLVESVNLDGGGSTRSGLGAEGSDRLSPATRRDPGAAGFDQRVGAERTFATLPTAVDVYRT